MVGRACTSESKRDHIEVNTIEFLRNCTMLTDMPDLAFLCYSVMVHTHCTGQGQGMG